MQRLNQIALPSYGAWTNHRIPQDRSGWHPLCRQFLDYWYGIAPKNQLPGRQHVAPTDLAALLPRLWMLDVHRNPLRFRYRLVGTAEVRTLGREVTGLWLDEVHTEMQTDPSLYDRYRFMVETKAPTWRRGPVNWNHDSEHHIVENCMVPLAADGSTVDIIFAISVLFYADGQPVIF